MTIKNKKQSIEYCTLHYLNQWLLHDRIYCKVLENGSTSEKLAIVKKAAAFYGVARNLRRKFDVELGLERYMPVIDILDTVRKIDFQPDPVKQILKLESDLSNTYGGRSVLSCTTKLLWFVIKEPVLIYDSQVRQALGSKQGNLPEYYRKWGAEYENHENEIRNTCSKLPDHYLYAVNQEIATKTYISQISSEGWFRKRVFDIFLWWEGR